MSFLKAGKLWTTETRSYSSSIFFSSCSHLDFLWQLASCRHQWSTVAFPQRGVLMTTAATDLAESLLGQAMADIPAGEVNVSPEISVQWSASRKKCLVVPGDKGGRRPIDMTTQKSNFYRKTQNDVNFGKDATSRKDKYILWKGKNNFVMTNWLTQLSDSTEERKCHTASCCFFSSKNVSHIVSSLKHSFQRKNCARTCFLSEGTLDFNIVLLQ